MDAETILNIALASLLGVMHLSALATCIIWRARKYRKGLHCSAPGFIFLFLSFVLGVLFPIDGFVFIDGGASGTELLIFAMVICPPLLALSVWEACYCVFLDGDEIVKRTLFSETRIDLSVLGTAIDDAGPFTVDFWISVFSPEGQVIHFNSRRIQGDVASFLEECKKIQKKNNPGKDGSAKRGRR